MPVQPIQISSGSPIGNFGNFGLGNLIASQQRNNSGGLLRDLVNRRRGSDVQSIQLLSSLIPALVQQQNLQASQNQFNQQLQLTRDQSQRESDLLRRQIEQQGNLTRRELENRLDIAREQVAADKSRAASEQQQFESTLTNRALGSIGGLISNTLSSQRETGISQANRELEDFQRQRNESLQNLSSDLSSILNVNPGTIEFILNGAGEFFTGSPGGITSRVINRVRSRIEDDLQSNNRAKQDAALSVVERLANSSNPFFSDVFRGLLLSDRTQRIRNEVSDFFSSRRDKVADVNQSSINRAQALNEALTRSAGMIGNIDPETINRLLDVLNNNSPAPSTAPSTSTITDEQNNNSNSQQNRDRSLRYLIQGMRISQ